MRIVIVSRIFSPEPSAASFMLEAVARAFRDTGHEVTVLTTTRPKGMLEPDIPGVRVKRAPVLRDASGYVRGYLPYLSFDVPLFFRLLFSRRADLYFAEPPPTTGAVVRAATWLLRRPYCYDAADIWSDAAKMATSSKFVLSVLRGMEIFALRGASHAFTISPGVATRMRELGVATATTVVGFGVDTEVFRYLPPQKAPGRPYFLYAGTYSEWHGAGIFVDAFALFTAIIPNCRLIFVGNGSDRALLEKKIRDAGVVNVEFLDAVDGPSLNTLFAGAIASLASLKPGQGYDYAFTTKIYSSIAAGCPVVFSGVGPTAEFIDRAPAAQCVGVATPYDVDAVTAAMVHASRAAPPAAQRRQLSNWARERYSLAAVAEVVAGTAIRLIGKR